MNHGPSPLPWSPTPRHPSIRSSGSGVMATLRHAVAGHMYTRHNQALHRPGSGTPRVNGDPCLNVPQRVLMYMAVYPPTAGETGPFPDRLAQSARWSLGPDF
jgi:hypothetical protein